jgi:NAD(P)-dependent dehydrogenase (short-subunit alcohol dehydrogenase family)
MPAAISSIGFPAAASQQQRRCDMTTDLGGKHALVSGGGSGIGAAISFALAQAGAMVTICGRRLDDLEFTAERHNNIHPETADVTDEASIGRLYQRAQKARGKFSIVVANAGIAESAPAEKVSRELWQKILDVNLTGAFFSVQPALAGMREQKSGRIIFIASTAGLKGYPYVAPYVAAKHGVVGLARALAIETAKAGITVNAVCPGFTETSLLDKAVDHIVATTQRTQADARTLLAANNPQGRFMQPQEVADVVVWLCSDDSAGITGQAISVSGGETW